jgi:hypothetical protein
MDNTNLIPAFTKELMKNKPSEIAAPQEPSKDTPAINSEASPLNPKLVRRAKNTKKPKADNTGLRPLATYIVKKYVEPSKINWPRDLIICYKLLKKYPEEHFWKWLPVKRQVESMALLYGEKARQRLQYAYVDYKKQKNVGLQIKIEKAPEIVLQAEKVGEDRVYEKRKTTIIDFCR